MSRIFAKTAKGKNEIQTRENRLPPRVRQLLICVDSKKTVADIRKMDVFQDQELADMMALLTAEGYIEISLESEAQAVLLKQQKEQAEQEEFARSEQGKLDAEMALKEQLMRDREEEKNQEAALKAALKAEKEEQRRRERDAVSGWSSTQMNNKQF